MLGVVLLQGISALTAPIFTRMLGANQYGEYGIFNAWIAVLSSFMGLGVGSTIGTGMYEFKDDYYRFRNSVFILGVISCFAITAMITAFSGFISRIIHFPEWLVALMPIFSSSIFITGFIQSALVFEKRPFLNLLLSVFVSLSTVVTSLVLVAQFPQDSRYLGRIIGSTVPQIIIAIIVGIVFFFRYPCGYERRYWFFSVSLGMPIVFHILSSRVLTQSDRLMMQYFGIDEADIGIYTAFYSFSLVLNTILSALNSSWVPFYYGYLNEKDADKLNSKSKNYIELLTVLSCGFILLSKEVGRIYAGKEYYSGIGVIPILVLAVFFTFMYQFPVNFEMYHKKTNIVAVGTFASAICNIVLNGLLIPVMSLYGAAIATAISYCLLFIFHYVNVKYRMSVPFHLNLKLFLIPLCMISICMLLFYGVDGMWYLRWEIGFLIGAYELVKIYKRRSIF